MPEASLPHTSLPHLVPHTLWRPGEADDSSVNWIWNKKKRRLRKVGFN